MKTNNADRIKSICHYGSLTAMYAIGVILLLLQIRSIF